VGAVEDIFGAIARRVRSGVGDEGPMVAVDEEVGIRRGVTVGEDVVDIEFSGFRRDCEDDQSGRLAVDDLLAGVKGLTAIAVVHQRIRAGASGERMLGMDGPRAVVELQRSEGTGRRGNRQSSEKNKAEHGGNSSLKPLSWQGNLRGSDEIAVERDKPPFAGRQAGSGLLS